MTRKVKMRRDQVGWSWLKILDDCADGVLDMDSQGAPSLNCPLTIRSMAGDTTAKAIKDCPFNASSSILHDPSQWHLSTGMIVRYCKSTGHCEELAKAQNRHERGSFALP